MASGNWARKVGLVFNTRPRIAAKNTVWLERKKASQRLAEALQRPGAHVCLDGPSGVGKTSLSSTQVATQALRHVKVMATAAMTWVEFCRRLVGQPTNDELAIGGELEVGLDKGLPIAKLRLSLGEKGRPLDDLSLAEKLANSWTEHDVAQRLVELDALLIVDDMERASDDLMRRIADLCKLLTQDYVSDNAKLLLIGSADVYQRLHKANDALDERVTQVSLGAFNSPNDSKHFMHLGFSKLGLRHPWNSIIPREMARRKACTTAIWEAADGLPKSLNRLGYEIALRAEDRSGVSSTDVIEEANKLTEEHWLQYGTTFVDVLIYLEQNPAAVALLRCLYSDGIARIHRWPHLVERLEKQENPPTTDAIDEALDVLTRMEFLVRTGKTGELVFVRHPTAAHTFGVVVSDPTRFPSIAEIVARNPLQLSLPITGLEESEVDSPTHDA